MGIGDTLSRPAVFLDRDGVLNAAIVRDGKPYPPASIEEMVVPQGVEEAIGALKAAGYELVVVTNQPDVARGTQGRGAVDAINDELGRRLGIAHFRVCFHDDADQCGCRKPMPGLLVDAARELSLDLAGSFMIGDRWRDVEAGRRAGVKTVWLDFGYRERQPETYDFRTHTLREAATWITAQQA